MMLRIAWRSLITHPLRAAVLAAGFGLGIAVMAALLGVGEVILEQAHSPALAGGGDLAITGAFGSVDSARFVMTGVLGSGDLASRVKASAPSRRARLFLMSPRGPIPVSARGGIPSLEKAVGDPEVASVAEWQDTAGDREWARPDPPAVLRAMDRFHAIPDEEGRWESSWAEWLYFNGRSTDGQTRLYLTFLVGPSGRDPGRRLAGVRLQIERDGKQSTYSANAEVDEAALLARAPDLEIAGNRVRLDGLVYRIALNLQGAIGELALESSAGRSMPPALIRGTNGWLSGYVVPVLSGTWRGALKIGAGSLVFDGATGYHDHNWGFWRDVTWQWGQVSHETVSVVYGRVFPPSEVADAARVPGFLAVLGPDGPLGFATDVSIDDTRLPALSVRARGSGLELRLDFVVDESVSTEMTLGSLPSGRPMTFLQLGGVFQTRGTVAGRTIEFTSRGAAETFRTR
jgi:hypothetical protein